MTGHYPGIDIATLSALAEPNRLKIVELLREGPLTVGEIAERLGIRQPLASKHLKVLTDANILNVQPDANKRYYKLRSEPFVSLDAWARSFKRDMEERYDRLEDYLQQLQQGNDNLTPSEEE